MRGTVGLNHDVRRVLDDGMVKFLGQVNVPQMGGNIIRMTIRKTLILDFRESGNPGSKPLSFMISDRSASNYS